MAEDVILYPVRNQLKKFFGGRDKLYPFMELNTMDMFVFEEDFVGKLDVTYKWGQKNSGGSHTGTVASTVNGICRLTSGSTSGNYDYIFPNTDGGEEGACWQGDHNPVMWVRLTMDYITSVKVECGWTDDDGDAGALSDLGTPTNNADDCAIWCFSTGDDTGYWQGVMFDEGSLETKYEPNVATVTPVGGTYEWLGVAIQGSAVKFMHMDQYGNPDLESAWLVNSIDSDIALIPWIGIHTLSNNDRLLDIDYIKCWQRRTTADD